MSYDEDGSSRPNNYGNRRGGRGGGRGRGGGGGGGGYEARPRRVLSPEAAAVNEALSSATTWRQLNTVLEQQVGVSTLRWLLVLCMHASILSCFTALSYPIAPLHVRLPQHPPLPVLFSVHVCLCT